jgi:sugar/nucleoside kinase (ribokinase family)
MKKRNAESGPGPKSPGGVNAGSPENSSHNKAGNAASPQGDGILPPAAVTESPNQTDQHPAANACPKLKGSNETHNTSAAVTLVREACDVFYVANTTLDCIAKPLGSPTGSKHPCQVEARAGGPAANGGQVFVANGYRSGVIGLQGAEWAETCRQKFNELGVESFIVKQKKGHSGALTLAFPDGAPGAFELYTQRMSPNLRLWELDRRLRRRIQRASIVVVGPMAAPDKETLSLLRWIPGNALYSVLQPHPDLVAHEAFAEIAALYDLVVLNASEAARLDPATNDVAMLALRLRHNLGQETAFIVTNGPDRGLAWLEAHWWPLDPPTVSCLVSDIGAGDVLTASFIAEYRLKGRPVRDALDAALLTAARWVSGQPLTVAGPNNGEFNDGAFGRGSYSWAETAL